MMSGPEILPLQAQAARGQVREPERSQFAHLLRHFLARFFNHETASSDGDAKTRLVQIAFVAGLPGFVVSLYLWPIYHPFPGWPPGHPSHGGPPPYWLQVNHHFFFVIYSFVVMGIVAVFEWDMFFPDAAGYLCSQTLARCPDIRHSWARVLAIAILLGGFLLDANFLAPLVLPAAIDPPTCLDSLPAIFWPSPAVVSSPPFSFWLFECVVLSVFGERWFRALSLLMQGARGSRLSLLLLLLFPVLSSVVPNLLRSGDWYVRCFLRSGFWGIYQMDIGRTVRRSPSTLSLHALVTWLRSWWPRS